MIFEHVAYDRDKNLLHAMNSFMNRMWVDDWVVFRDHDTLFCGNDWWPRIEDAIEEKGNTGIYTGWCNRVNCEWQVDQDSPRNDDLQDHWDYDFFREPRKIIDRTDYEQVFSGFLMVIQKQQWLRIAPLLKSTLLGMDNEIHHACRELGLRLYQIDLYLYHRYRWGVKADNSHL